MRLFYALILTLSVSIYADFLADMDSLSREMVQTLEIPSDKPFSISATAMDENYMLPLNSLYTLLEKSVRRHNRKFVISMVDGENQRIAQSLYVKAQEGGYENVEVRQGKVDSLIIGAKLFLTKEGDLDVQFIVCDFSGAVKYKSTKLMANKNGPERRQLVDIFDEISDDVDVENVRYREKVITALNLQMLKDSALTSGDNVFKFEKNWPYANIQQMDALDMILRTKYAFRFDSKVADKIIVNRVGGVEFHKRGHKLEIAGLVDVEPIVDDKATFPVDSVTVPIDDSGERFGKTAMDNSRSSVLEKIKFIVEKVLVQAYNKPDLAFLDTVYHCTGKCILTGRIEKDDRLGKEKVQYFWMDKTEYLASMKRKVEKEHYTFDVDLKVMNLYQEEPNRYWVVARQIWKTKNRKGAVVYRDDGFLFLNFDFTNGINVSPRFKIYYRIWLYNYCFGQPELKMNRADLVERDFNGVFFAKEEKVPKVAAESTGIGGLKENLRKVMRQDLMLEVRKHDTELLKPGK